MAELCDSLWIGNAVKVGFHREKLLPVFTISINFNSTRTSLLYLDNMINLALVLLWVSSVIAVYRNLVGSATQTLRHAALWESHY